MDRYLVEDKMKDHVIKCFATGFISHFEYDPPDPWGHVDNYTPLAGTEGEAVLRRAMMKEVVAGRMIKGPRLNSKSRSAIFQWKEFLRHPL